MFYQTVWEGYYNSVVNNPAGVPMSLASNSVIIPPEVARGAKDVAMVLTCGTAVTGPTGELPNVTVPEGDIVFTVAGMTTVNYAAPGNSYPSDFQLLTLTVSVAPKRGSGLAEHCRHHPPQPGTRRRRPYQRPPC